MRLPPLPRRASRVDETKAVVFGLDIHRDVRMPEADDRGAGESAGPPPGTAARGAGVVDEPHGDPGDIELHRVRRAPGRDVGRVVVADPCVDRGQSGKLVEYRGPRDVTRMKDEIGATCLAKDGIRKGVSMI